MRKIFFVVVLFSSLAWGQYNGERTTEQNFEESSLYFTPHYLNPFGISSFENVAPGLIDNPFLNLYVNPASLPNLGGKDVLAYIDFRGDRTEAPIVQNYAVPYYFASSYYRPYYDPRWMAQSRVESEPIFSIGILTYPISELTRKFFLGGTFQFIHGEDKYYQMPYSIYSPVYAYDSFGVAVRDASSIPIKDRYTGRDDMVTDAKLFSLFAGYKLSDKLTVGASLDGVFHTRNGGYGNTYSDEYGNTDYSQWSNSALQTRDEKYHHLDISAGLNYTPVHNITLGLKAGILNGKADQNYISSSDYYYKYNTPDVSSSWSYSISNNSTIQSWNHDGSTKYLGINFKRKIENGKEINFYYKYSRSNIDLSTTSSIEDTSYSSYRSVSSYDNSWSQSLSFSSTHDNRYGNGKRINNSHEAMLSLKWKLTELNTINVGFYMSSNDVSINSNEPVMAVNTSSYTYTSSNSQYNSDYYQKLIEDKTLVWTYTSDKFSFQIPILVDFRFSKHWGMMLGINRIFNEWDITDKTIAYFKMRERIQGTDDKKETNFGEAYTQPEQKLDNNSTKLFASFDASITSSFKARLSIDPNFEHIFHIDQWWLSFELKM